MHTELLLANSMMVANAIQTPRGLYLDNTPGFRFYATHWPPPRAFYVSLWSEENIPPMDDLKEALTYPLRTDGEYSHANKVNMVYITHYAAEEVGGQPDWSRPENVVGSGPDVQLAIVFSTDFRFNDRGAPGAIVRFQYHDSEEDRSFADFLCPVKVYFNLEGPACLDGKEGIISAIGAHFADTNDPNRIAFLSPSQGAEPTQRWCIG